MAKKAKQKNLTLDDRTWEQLEEVEADTTLTASALFRQCIQDLYRKMLERKAQERTLLSRSE